ncbi:MAG TPA: hypothetical protein VKZ58_06055 [Longimicrobiales bacterium]|nr:hypothetical protein [Longimicrobiales bacterium]
MNTHDYATRDLEIHGWTVRVTSYATGGRYHASVESVDVGARFARADGATREEAESIALDKARERLARTPRR